MTPALEFETFSLEQVCELTGALSTDWLYRRIVRGELPACHNGKAWRMTRADMAAVVDHMRILADKEVAKRGKCRSDNTVTVAGTGTAATNPAGLTPRAAARLRRRAAATP